MQCLKVAVCDDDETISGIVYSTIKSAFKRKNVVADIECFVSGFALLKSIEVVKYDLIFLDIDMPNIDGIDVGKKIRQAKDNAEIIYVSSHEERVFETFLAKPFAFIRKNNFLNDVSECINRYLKQISSSVGDSITLHTRSGIVNVSLKDILYFEGSGKYQLLHLNGKENSIVVYRSMDILEKELSQYGFLRIHKGFLVNYIAISAIKTGEVLLLNGESLPISRRKVTEIKQKYLERISAKGGLLI